MAAAATTDTDADAGTGTGTGAGTAPHDAVCIAGASGLKYFFSCLRILYIRSSLCCVVFL